MRVVLAQINPTVGDIAGNTKRVLDGITAAEGLGAGFTLFPELVLTGYPPEDLLAREHFVDEQLDALEQVASASRHSIIVGFVDRIEGRLYNAAALLGNGRVLRTYHKRRLPNYGVFDERRYFEPGQAPGIFELGGTLFDMTVCEDVWVPEIPIADAAEGAQVLFNISASPYYHGKGAEREQMLRERAMETGMWLAYCNLVGGQDELVFDGRSVVISPTGEVIARGKAFEEDMVFADFAAEGKLGASGRIEADLGDEEEVYHAIVTGLGDYFRKNGFTDAVLGLSGGIDSALTACIAVDALGADSVHGVLMPSPYSSEGSLTDARELATNLGIETSELPISETFASFVDELAPLFKQTQPDVTEENIQARVRAILLMALSNKFGWIVLATGNKSELSVGYSTLYGDMVGGFAPLKDVFKTRVYQLARWRNRDGTVIPQDTIDKPPSAELRPGQTDQDSLPPYDVLDSILERYVERDQSRETIIAAGYDTAMVDRVLHMTDTAEYKRRQGPIGVKITPKAFGKDRRMPITNAYRG